MGRAFKLVILFFLKALGIFHLSRYITQKGLRILGYHGIAIGDQYKFNGGTFIRREIFERRLKALQRLRYPVLSLEEAINQFKNGTLPSCATVITIDDGWYSTYQYAVPLLLEYQFPATIYVATSYVEQQIEIFQVFVDYAFWKTTRSHAELSSPPPGLEGKYNLRSQREKKEFLNKLIQHARTCTIAGREAFIRQIAEALDLDMEKIKSTRELRFMTSEQLREIKNQGIDLQLHTHHHRLPATSRESCQQEILDNQTYLFKAAGIQAHHFCYPDGFFDKSHRNWLKELNLQSAVTCVRALNYPSADYFFLGRLLDQDRITDLEFEAELCGLLDILRIIRNGGRSLVPLLPRA